MLRIIHIIPNLNIGGAERLTTDICNYIFENKLGKVKLITFNKKIIDEIPFHINIPSCFVPSLIGKRNILLKNLQKFINEFKPDIIHSHLWESEILLTQINIGKAIRFTHFHDNMVE